MYNVCILYRMKDYSMFGCDVFFLIIFLVFGLRFLMSNNLILMLRCFCCERLIER